MTNTVEGRYLSDIVREFLEDQAKTSRLYRKLTRRNTFARSLDATTAVLHMGEQESAENQGEASGRYKQSKISLYEAKKKQQREEGF